MIMFHIFIPTYKNNHINILSYKSDNMFRIDYGKNKSNKSNISNISNKSNKKLILKVNDDTIECSLSELQLSYDMELFNEKTSLLEYSNKLYDDINQDGLFYIPELQLKVKEITVSATVNQDKLMIYLIHNLKSYNQFAKDATVKIEGNKFTYTKEVFGQGIVLDKLIEEVNHSLDNWNGNDIVIQVDVISIKPDILRADLKKSKDILGEFTTKFIPNKERENNLLNGIEFIHGYVLKPGDIFSARNELEPFTKENGYDISNAFSEGDLVQSVGGGVCQLTTTLYNAVLYAELEIIERFEHSMQVSYVEASRDATITTKYKDFKFRNNTNGNIIIAGKVINGEISFTLYGKEERDIKNRRIDFQVIKKRYITPEKAEIFMDKSLKGIKESLVRESRFGSEAELYKIIYIKDKEVDRILINTSKYTPLTSLIRIGYD